MVNQETVEMVALVDQVVAVVMDHLLVILGVALQIVIKDFLEEMDAKVVASTAAAVVEVLLFMLDLEVPVEKAVAVVGVDHKDQEQEIPMDATTEEVLVLVEQILAVVAAPQVMLEEVVLL